METPRPTSALANYLKHHHTGAVAGCRLAAHLARRDDASPPLRGLDTEIGPSSSRSVLELETLAIGIEGKRRLWMSLKLLSGHHTAIDGSHLDELLRRADGQLVAVESARLDAAAKEFHAGWSGIFDGPGDDRA